MLVHVLDSTGKSDTDGNIIESSEGTDNPSASSEILNCSSPLNDAVWVREELHRWIHGNIKAKWASVFRKGKERAVARVAALFSGYRCTREFADMAISRSRLSFDKPNDISALDLHRLVAHFLSVRFPMCLALNKVDDFSDMEQAASVVLDCQRAAVARGE